MPFEVHKNVLKIVTVMVKCRHICRPAPWLHAVCTHKGGLDGSYYVICTTGIDVICTDILNFSFVQCDIVSLQNQVLIIYNVARTYPKQAAFELQLTCLQPLLNCSSLPLRVISKSIVAFLAGYMDISHVPSVSLTSDEVKLFADSLTSFVNPGSTSADNLKLSVEKLLYSFQQISSLPWDKSCCALPCLLDALLALSSYSDKTIATSTLEVLWSISMEPTVALAILCHENMVCTLQNMSVFNNALADLARSVLWILGYGNVGGECHRALYRNL